MKKLAVVLISAVLIASFAGLIYYGLTHSRGRPVETEVIKTPAIDVPFIDEAIDLTKGISAEAWQTIQPQEIGLVYQVTVLPWPVPRGQLEPVLVKAFHNNKDIYFFLRWKDNTEDRVFETDQFSDACAIMFAMDEKAQPHSIMMGFLGKANIWHWKASQDLEFWLKKVPEVDAYADYHYPFEDAETLPTAKEDPKHSANDLFAIRIGTVTPKETQTISGRGFWKDGVWQVVFKRSLRATDPEVDADFKPGKRLCAFALWDGAKGDRGGRKTISDWAELDIK